MKMPLTFYFKVSRQCVIGKIQTTMILKPALLVLGPLVTLKGQENQKALMVAQAKGLMVVSAK